jgi:hypothetical protein
MTPKSLNLASAISQSRWDKSLEILCRTHPILPNAFLESAFSATGGDVIAAFELLELIFAEANNGITVNLAETHIRLVVEYAALRHDRCQQI